MAKRGSPAQKGAWVPGPLSKVNLAYLDIWLVYV